MKPVLSFVALPIAASLLASCGDRDREAASHEMLAGGKILQRSISDDMLPYDTVRSQPPLAKPEKGEAGTAAPDGTGDDTAEEPEAAQGGETPQSEEDANAGSATPDEE